MTSCRKDNWSVECENALNEQIALEYWASYQYHLMWSYFVRSEVGLAKVAKYFKEASDEERGHAHKFMEYQNLRGGQVKLTDLKNINLDYLQDSSKNDLLLSLEKALEMEQFVYKGLLKLHKSAENDPAFSDFVESEYLEEQVKAINELAKQISQLQRIGKDGHGVWHFAEDFH